MRKIATLAVLAVLFAPTLASAQLSLGARLGYAFAMGEAEEGIDVSDGAKAQIPIQLDVGYRATPALTLGGYFSYGFGRIGGDAEDYCDVADVDCSARVYRLGLQLEYRFAQPAATPWLGAGIGYEWAKLEYGNEKLSYSGFEFLNLQGGVEWKAGEKFWVGPFAMLSLAKYSNSSYEAPGVDGEADVDGMHQWMQLGVRGRFDL